MVNVYEGRVEDEGGSTNSIYGGSEGIVIAQVEYNSNLDHWDGYNWTCGETGRHLGVTQLEDKRFVLIHGTQWQGEKAWAEVVTDEKALQAILKHDESELNAFPELVELRDKTILSEK
jgi:hypothetical protein